MNKRFKMVAVIVAVVAVLALVLSGTVFAAGPLKTQNLPNTQDYYGGCGGYVNIDAVSQLLGITTAEIQTQLQEGKTLVEIAATVGVTEDALVDVIIVAHQERIQSMVTAGIMTQEQADLRLQWMEQQIRAAVNQTYTGGSYNGNGTGGCGYGQAGAGMGPGMMQQWNQNNQGTGALTAPGRGPGMMGRGFGGFGMMGGGGMMGRIW